MNEHLQPWYDKWLEAHRDTDLICARATKDEPRLEQVHFVRDTLGGLWWADVPYEARPSASPRDDCKEDARVIGEHHSKSVRLPVYLLERPDLGLAMVLRDNYYDWNISVLSETPVETDLRGFVLDYTRDGDRERFHDGYQPGRSWGYCFFQGFPTKYQFGPFSENPRRFSLWTTTPYEVFTLSWLLLRDRRK
jgi:hypothetical protein